MERELWVGRLRQLETKVRAGYKVVRAEGGGLFHRVAKAVIHDPLLALEILGAPNGELVKDNEVVAKGKVLGSNVFIDLETGEFHIPNSKSPYSVRVSSQK